MGNYYGRTEIDMSNKQCRFIDNSAKLNAERNSDINAECNNDAVGEDPNGLCELHRQEVNTWCLDASLKKQLLIFNYQIWFPQVYHEITFEQFSELCYHDRELYLHAHAGQKPHLPNTSTVFDTHMLATHNVSIIPGRESTGTTFRIRSPGLSDPDTKYRDIDISNPIRESAADAVQLPPLDHGLEDKSITLYGIKVEPSQEFLTIISPFIADGDKLSVDSITDIPIKIECNDDNVFIFRPNKYEGASWYVYNTRTDINYDSSDESTIVPISTSANEYFRIFLKDDLGVYEKRNRYLIHQTDSVKK